MAAWRNRGAEKIERKKAIVRRHFDNLSSVYENTSSKRRNFFEGEHSVIADDMRRKGAVKALDVAAGTASRTVELQARSGASFEACDFSPEMVKLARAKIPGAKVSDLGKLDYPSGSFNALTCVGYSFSYLASRDERLQALREFNRVLGKNGFLYLDAANRWHLGENREYAKTLLHNVLKLPFGVSGETYFTVKLEGKKLKGYLHSFRLGELKSLLQKAGFEIEKVIYIGFSSGEIKKGFSRRLFGQPLIIAKKKGNNPA